MIKPHLWSKSVDCVGKIYWWIKCIEAGKDPNDYDCLLDMIEDLTNS